MFFRRKKHEIIFWTHLFSISYFYNPWKHQKALRFPDVFRGYRNVVSKTSGLKPIFRINVSTIKKLQYNFGRQGVRTISYKSCECFMYICDALHNLVPLVQFKKREKHPWRSVTFSKAVDWSMQFYHK